MSIENVIIQKNCPSKNKEEIKTFSDIQKLKKFVTTRLALQETLKRSPAG